MNIQDPYNRQFRTLRVSLTNVCNLACVYCLPDTELSTKSLKPKQQTRDQIIDHVKRLHKLLNLKTVRLTGGEPLLYRDLIPLISDLKSIGIPEIKITTNAYLLEEKCSALKEAGITSLNISLDAVHQQIFKDIARRGNLNKIIRGIDKACSLNIPVKLNAVIIKGVNDNQILPLFDFARNRNIQIRYLELMEMGHLHEAADDLLISEAQILEVLSESFSFKALDRKSSSTANLWETTDGYVFGIIANKSTPFCADCDRLRIDSQGNMFGCLSSNIPVKLLSEDNDETWTDKLQTAMSHKQLVRFTGSELSMLEIGG